MGGFPASSLLIGLTLFFLIIEIHGNPYELNEDNWKDMLNDEWMVQFVAPWCPSCKIVAPIWERFEKIAGKFNVKVGTVDITKSPSLSGRFFVTSLPSIYHVIDGKFRFYRGNRDIDALIEFIKFKQWENVPPISRWNDPNAYHMGILSYFFRLSLMLKEWNVRLRDEFGFSVYGSYGLFVLITILIGAAFGLLLITLLDFVCPSKKRKRRDFVEIKNLNDQSDEVVKNLINDDIEDVGLENHEDSVIKTVDENDEETENEQFLDANHGYIFNENNEIIAEKGEDDDFNDMDEFHTCRMSIMNCDIQQSTRKRTTI